MKKILFVISFALFSLSFLFGQQQPQLVEIRAIWNATDSTVFVAEFKHSALYANESCHPIYTGSIIHSGNIIWEYEPLYGLTTVSVNGTFYYIYEKVGFDKSVPDYNLPPILGVSLTRATEDKIEMPEFLKILPIQK